MTETERLLLQSNELLRSAHAIAVREGRATDWMHFREQLEAALKEQHAVTNALRDQSQ